MSDIEGMDEDPLEDAEEEIEKLEELLVGLEGKARSMGLYLDRHLIVPVQTPTGVKPGVYAEFLIGEVAFSPRVQNPDDDEMNREFRKMVAGVTGDEFLQKREEMKRRLEAGKSIFDEDSSS